MSSKKIFCFDLDMTLLDHATYQVSENSMRALRKLQEAGHVVAIATGRDMDSEFSIAFARQLQPTAIVHSNGQKVSIGNRVIREIFMEKSLIQAILDFAKEKGLCVGYNIGKYGCYVNKEVLMEQERRLYGKSDREYLDEANLLEHRFYALAYFGDPSGARLLAERFPQLKLPFFSGQIGADILTKDVSKANGIRALLDYYKKDWSDVIAFGDSMNDFEMLSEAGIGVAMGNAVDELKQIADYVTLPVWQEGVCCGLQHLGYI